MPAGAHGFKGAHDPEMVAKAVELGFGSVSAAEGEVSVDVTVKNVGAGHFFPTTATPRAVLQVQLVGPSGPIEGTRKTWPIGRTVTHLNGRWSESDDTRIPPRSERRWSYSATRGEARWVEAAVFFYPDWIYIGFYQGQLARPDLPKDARAALESALETAESSVITAAVLRRGL